MKKMLFPTLFLLYFTSFPVALATPQAEAAATATKPSTAITATAPSAPPAAPSPNTAAAAAVTLPPPPTAAVVYNRYTDSANGYSLSYPSDMYIDDSQSAVRTVIQNDSTKIEIYYDNFTGTVTDADNYITYGNKFAQNTKDYVIMGENNFTVNGMPVHLLKWMRAKLARVDNDQNYYASAEIVKNKTEVYTLFFKSTDPITLDKTVIQSFRLVPKSGTANLYRQIIPAQNHFNAETQAVYQRFFAADAPLRWGIFEKTSPKDFTYLKTLEQQLHYTFPVVTRYQSLTGQYFPDKDLKNAYDNGRLVELTLQTFLWGGTDEQNQRIMYDVLDGHYDAFLNDYAKKLKAFGHPVLFRLNNEMNGDWCWYSAFTTCKDTDIYKDVWRYIYQIFETNGVENVIWIWNPHSPSKPTFQWNHYMMYYPGDEYVDVIGLTGYNNGTYYPGEIWRSFDQIYQHTYEEYAKNFPQPFMIAEFASNSVGGDKAAWVQNMFASLANYNRIKLAVWWSSVDYDAKGHPARIYTLDENPDVISAFRSGLADAAH